MKSVNLTEGDKKLIKIAEAIIGVNPPTQEALLTVPLFAETLALLREKLTHTETQSVARHKAKSTKEAVVADVSKEKEDLAMYVSKALGAFTEFLNQEKNSQLANMLPNLTLAKLSKQNSLNMVTTINTFVARVEELNTQILATCGINKTWLPMLKNKVVAYKANNAAKETLKSNQPKETTQFRAVMNDIKGYLTTLTNLIGGYETAAPEFYRDCTQILVPPKKKPSKNARAKTAPKTPKKTTSKTPKKTAENPSENPTQDIVNS